MISRNVWNEAGPRNLNPKYISDPVSPKLDPLRHSRLGPIRDTLSQAARGFHGSRGVRDANVM